MAGNPLFRNNELFQKRKIYRLINTNYFSLDPTISASVDDGGMLSAAYQQAVIDSNQATIIDYNFKNPTDLTPPKIGNRFTPDSGLEWYGSPQVGTAIEEVAHHTLYNQKEFMQDNITANDLSLPAKTAKYKLCTVELNGLLLDVSSHVKKYPLLVDDSYNFTQAFASKAVDEGVRGILFKSARAAKGTCVVVYQHSMLTQPNQTKTISFKIDSVKNKISPK